jgi:hypothetical protein
LLQFCLLDSKAQNKLSIYGNIGFPFITNFEYKPNVSFYGNFGVKYNFYKGVSVSLESSAVIFKQSTDISILVANYYTQTNGLGFVLMNETSFSKNWYLGIGAGVSIGMFTGRVFAQNEGFYYQLTGLSKIRFSEIISTFKGQLNFRRKLNKYFDTQFGLSYNYAQSNFLNMYTEVNKKKDDTFTVLYAGFLYKFGNGPKGSKSLKCPSF